LRISRIGSVVFFFRNPEAAARIELSIPPISRTFQI